MEFAAVLCGNRGARLFERVGTRERIDLLACVRYTGKIPERRMSGLGMNRHAHCFVRTAAQPSTPEHQFTLRSPLK